MGKQFWKETLGSWVRFVGKQQKKVGKDVYGCYYSANCGAVLTVFYPKNGTKKIKNENIKCKIYRFILPAKS